MSDLSNAGLASQLSTQATRWSEYINQQKDWLAGTATGGPNSDGRYPLTNGVGLTLLIACPAKLGDSVSGPAVAATVAAEAAELARSIAASHAATAEQQADIAEAAKIAVLTSVADSEAAALAAQGFAANAATSASTAAGHANGLANAVSNLNQNTLDLANSVSFQAALTTLVTDARADVSAKALTVSLQANAVALANSTVTADMAIILTAKADTLGFRDEADGFAYDAGVRMASTTAARDLTLGYRDTASGHANTATTQAGFSMANAVVASGHASTATTQAGLSNTARIAAEAARDAAEAIAGGDAYQSKSVILTDIASRGAIGTANATSIADRSAGDARWLLNSLKATQAEAQAGSSDTKWMTPLRVKDAVLQHAPAPTFGTSAEALAATSAAGVSTAVSRSDHAHQFPLASVSQTLTATGSLAASDHGKIVLWNSASAALTLPANLPVGFNTIVMVSHASGLPTFTAASGATIRQADGFTKARKRYSSVTVFVLSNAGGSAAEYILTGDMSA